METKIKITFLAIFLLLLSSFSFASIAVANGSFETGDFTNWTVAQDVNALNPLDQLFVSADANVFVGSNATYDLNSFEGGFEVAGIELGGCAGAFKMAFRFGSSNGVTLEADEREILTQGDPQVPIYHVTYPTQICEPSPTAGNLAITLLTRQPPTSLFGGTRITHTSQQVEVGDVICVNTQAGHSVSGTCEAAVTFDNVVLVGHTLDVTLPVEPVPSNTSFEIRATVTDVNGSAISVADVNLLFGGDENVMSFSNGAYRITFNNGLPDGDHAMQVKSTFESVEKTFDFNLTVRTQEFQYLTITPIENINRFEFNSVDLFPNAFTEQMIWRVDSNSSSTETPTFKIFNPTLDGRQYFIFTSSDGIDFAFDDTLTFGSTNTNPIQKIWKENRGPVGQYEYSFEDTLLAGETKFYKLTYRMPHKHYFTIGNNPDWFETLRPNFVEDINRLNHDEFNISVFSNIRSILIEHVPDVFQDETAAFEFQFTAWSDVNGTSIIAGTTVNEADTTETVELTGTPQRFSFTIDASSNFDTQLLLKTNNSTSAKVFITDYAVIARGFFTKRLEVLKANGDTLDSFLLNNLSRQFLQEGTPFRISAEAYDREGVLETLAIQSFLDGNAADNKLTDRTAQVYNVNFPEDKKPETRIPLDELFDGLIDISGNATTPDPPRDVIIRVELTDINGVIVAVQSETLKFLQYPYFPDDLTINFFPTEKRRGKHPKGILELTLKRPETLEAVDIRIFDVNTTVTSPDFQEILYKDIDFTCIGQDCSFQVEIDKFLFEDINLNTITILARLTTEALDVNNRLIRTDRRIFISAITFEIAKIHQIVERDDDTYRNDEEIPLVLILRDDEVTDTSDKLDIFMTLRNCDSNSGSPNCVQQTIQYKPTAHIYDNAIGVNYYFFRHFFVLDDGSLLPDGNFISFRATVQDQLGIRSTITPVLASKCKNKDFVAEFLDNPIAAVGSFIYDNLSIGIVIPCNTVQEKVVTTTENTGQEEFLLIDEDHATSSPTQEGFVCISPDSNNILSEPFKQDFICAIVYTVGEKPIDNFRMRITNQFSDVRKEGPTQTFLEFNFPFEVIAYNDIFLLQNELKLNQNTTVDTLGEFIYEGFRNIVKTNFQIFGLEDFVKFNLQQSTTTNLGGDLNFNLAFSPQNVTGIYFIRIKGLPVLNMQDFRFDPRLEDDFVNIPESQFLEVLTERNVPFNKQVTRSEIFTTSFNSPLPFESEGVLLINEAPTEQQINRQNLANVGQNKFPIVPSVLRFNLQNTMFFNNFSEQQVLTGNITVIAIIKDTFNNPAGFLGFALKFGEEFIKDPVNVGTDFLFTNIILIMIILGLLTSIGLVVVLFTRK